MTVVVTGIPEPVPSRADPANFPARGDAAMLAINPMCTSMNAQNVENNAINANVNAKAAEVAALAAVAEGQASFVGPWAQQTGPLAMPACVSHPNVSLELEYWVLVSDLADVTTAEPGVSAAWVLYPADAETVPYDNTTSGLAAENVQAAVDEVAEDVSYLTSAQGGGFKNRFTNGCFRVNQRNVSGTVSGTGGALCHDRLFGDVSIGGTYTFATVNGVVVLTFSGGVWHQTIFGEQITGDGVNATVPYTLSWKGTVQLGINGIAAPQASPLTVNLTPGTTISININAGTGGTLSQVQLEPGTRATEFEFRPYAVELEMCQRDYYRETASAAGEPYSGIASTLAGSFRVIFKNPVPMRLAPTVFEASATPGDFQLVHGATATALSSSFTMGPTTKTVVILASNLAGLTEARPGYLRSTSAAATYVAWGTGY